jgi:hypothetical protein
MPSIFRRVCRDLAELPDTSLSNRRRLLASHDANDIDTLYRRIINMNISPENFTGERLTDDCVNRKKQKLVNRRAVSLLIYLLQVAESSLRS